MEFQDSTECHLLESNNMDPFSIANGTVLLAHNDRLTSYHYFEASKPVCIVAMHYQLPFMISKCLLQSP